MPVSTPAFGGRIAQVRRAGDTLYLAGSFLGASPREEARGGLSIHSATSSMRSIDTPYIRGTVRAVLPDGAGGFFLGGDFQAVGESARRGLARIMSNGALDPTFADMPPEVPGPGGRVFALARAANTLFVGGNFLTAMGQARSGLVALNAATGAMLPLTFELQGSLGRPDGTVSQLAVLDDTLYVIGGFRSVGGQARSNIAAFDTRSAALSSWNPGVSSNGAIIVDRTMYVGGTISMQAIDLASGAVRPFGPRITGDVTTLAAVGNALIIGGLFSGITQSGTFRRSNLAAIDRSSGELLPWAPEVNESIGTITVAGNTVYVGGGFTRVNDESRAGVAAFDWGADGRLLSWNPSMNGSVLAIAVDGPRVVLGGEFTAPSAEVRRSVAALDGSTGELKDWRTDVRGSVDTMAISDGRMFLGGDGTEQISDRGMFLVTRDLSSGDAVAWAMHPDGPVRRLEARSGVVYATGLFREAGTQERRGFAAFDPDGNLLPLELDRTRSGVGAALTASDTHAYIGHLQGIDAIERASRTSRPLNVPLLAGANDLALSGATLYIATPFILSQAGEIVRKQVAAVDTGSGDLTPWNPGDSLRHVVTVISAHGDQVMTAGTSAVLPDGRITSSVATMGANGDVSSPELVTLSGGTVDALFFDDDLLALGGSFGFVGEGDDEAVSPAFALFRLEVSDGQ